MTPRKVQQTKAIFSKWDADSIRGFIRHINNNKTDNRISNLQRVSYYEAFCNPEWTTDWVCALTNEEIKYVKDNWEWFKWCATPRP